MRDPSKSTAQETELLFGHSFRVVKTKKKWAYGQAISPLDQDIGGYTGWVRREHLAQDVAKPTHYVSALKAPVFKRADIKSRIKQLMPLGAHINAARVNAPFCELASGGFVHLKHLMPLGDYPETDFVTLAEAHMGLPYIWAGVSSDGLDCSGLVLSSLRGIGRDCLRDAGQQEESLGTALDVGAEMRRGDLVFWSGHVGIMSSPETLLHANAFHMKVVVEPFAAAAARIGAPRCIKRL